MVQKAFWVGKSPAQNYLNQTKLNVFLVSCFSFWNLSILQRAQENWRAKKDLQNKKDHMRLDPSIFVLLFKLLCWYVNSIKASKTSCKIHPDLLILCSSAVCTYGPAFFYYYNFYVSLSLSNVYLGTNVRTIPINEAHDRFCTVIQRRHWKHYV